MKALLFVVGLVFVVAGVATGVMSQTDYGNALIGLNLGLAAILLVGGFVIIGLGSTIGAISRLADDMPQSLPSASTTSTHTDHTISSSAGTLAGASRQEPKDDMPFPAATAAVGAATGAAGLVVGSALDKASDSVDAAVDKVAEVANEAKDKAADAVDDVADSAGELADEAKDSTLSAIDDVAQDAKEVVTGSQEEPKPEVEDASEDASDESGDNPGEADGGDEEAENDAESEEGDQLYIVEEVEIRGKPARVLSDNTVEAETTEGWMRFENIEHLEEYLDAMEA